jgi:hypothetical protein
MSASSDDDSRSDLNEAEAVLASALRRYSQALSVEVHGLAEMAIANKKQWNAFRLEVMLPRYQRIMKDSLGAFLFERDGLLLEHAGETQSYCREDPETRGKCWETIRFPEPDEHYLALVRKALGPDIKVWVQHRGRFLGYGWALMVGWSKCPPEHRLGQAEARRRKRNRNSR